MEGDLEFNLKPFKSRFYSEDTNGPNDEIPFSISFDSGPGTSDPNLLNDYAMYKKSAHYKRGMNDLSRGGRWVKSAIEAILDGKGSLREVEVRPPTRNELNREIELRWRERNPRLTKGRTCEPIYKTKIYETLLEWVPMQEQIVACAFQLTDFDLLLLLESVPYFDVIIDGGDYLYSDKLDAVNARIFYNRMTRNKSVVSRIRCYSPDHYKEIQDDNKYELMHSKWMLGQRTETVRGKSRAIYSLIFGSYNFTNAAKTNIESALYFPEISSEFYQDMIDDYSLLACHPAVVEWDNECF